MTTSEFLAERKLLLESELPRIRDQLIRLCRPTKIILFGSLADGTQTGTSDIDLVVIGPSEKPFKQRQADLYKELDYHIETDVLYYTEEEYERLAETSSFIRQVEKTGTVIYPDLQE